ncbi:MAG: exosome complex RNA-binding protein Rrp4 [Candidatus Bathyarchaeia archaeon]
MATQQEERKLVFPGDLIAEGDYYAGDNTFKRENKIYATRIGLASKDGRRISVIALRGTYEPKVGDTVIGKVIDIGFTNWTLDILSPYIAILNASDVFRRGFDPHRDSLSDVFGIGDIVLAEVAQFDRTRDPLLTVRGPGLGKLTKGRLERITPAKIPRLIGKKGSMITLLKNETGCQITIGKNGYVHILGKSREAEELVSLAIRKIEAEAHIPGLTNRMTEFLRTRIKGSEEKEKKVKDKGGDG